MAFGQIAKEFLTDYYDKSEVDNLLETNSQTDESIANEIVDIHNTDSTSHADIRQLSTDNNIVAFTYDIDLRTLSVSKNNGQSVTTILPKADEVSDGLMSKEDYSTLEDLVSKVASLANNGVWRQTYATYNDLITAYPSLDVSSTSWNVGDYIDVNADESASTSTHTQNNPSRYTVQVAADNTTKTLVFNRDISSAVSQATNTSLGTIKGTLTGNGNLTINSDGTGTVIGWDTQTIEIANKINKLSVFTAGNLVTLDSNGSIVDSGLNSSNFATSSQGDLADTAYQKPTDGIPETDLTQEVQDKLNSSGSGGYQKPATGIPKTDLAGDVQISLNKADISYSKPTDGIPESDLAQEVKDKIDSAVGGGYVKPSTGIPESDLDQSVQDKLNSVTSGGYVKPVDGIPETDLASNVQSLLDLAGTAYQKPATGIVESDLSQDIQDKIDSAVGGGYVKPSDGIPSTDLSASVQASLTKADNAASATDLTTHTSDTTIHTTIAEKTSWNNKYDKPTDGIPESDLAQAVQDKIDSAVGGGYVKPADGIPATDLTENIQNSINLANTSYQKPVTGIPESDLNQDLKDKIDASIAGGYVKPASGIPESDLTQSVQDSLILADNAVSTTNFTTHTDDTVIHTTQAEKDVWNNKYTKSNDGIPETDLDLSVQGKLDSIEDLYTKPLTGIPYSDLSNDVQTSLANADTAYQKSSFGIPESDLSVDLQNKIDDASDGYIKPIDGIPSTDMTVDVQVSLTKADTAYQKPTTGITEADLAQDIQDKLDNIGSDYYTKPVDGIPEADLSQDIQDNLTLAGTALQSYTETDPTVPEWAKAATKPTYTASEVGAVSITDFTTHTSDTVVHTSQTEKDLWAAKYNKPVAGIPATDLTTEVQASLTKADDSLNAEHATDVNAHSSLFSSKTNKATRTLVDTTSETIDFPALVNILSGLVSTTVALSASFDSNGSLTFSTLDQSNLRDYDGLKNRPSINNIVLTGNKSASDLGLATPATMIASDIASISYNANLSTLYLTKGNGNILTVVLPEASDTGSGLMPSSVATTLNSLVDEVSSLVSGGVWRGNFATYDALNTAYPNLDVSLTNWSVNDFIYVNADESATTVLHTQGSKTFYIVQVDNTDPNNIIKTLAYMEDVSSSISIQQANNTQVGVVKGSTTGNWNCKVNSDGTLTVNGGAAVDQSILNIQTTLGTKADMATRTLPDGVTTETINFTDVISVLDGFVSTRKNLGVSFDADGALTFTANDMSGSGSGGTSDYSELTSKPSINNVVLAGNQTTSDLGLASATDMTNADIKSIAYDNATRILTLTKGDNSVFTYTMPQASASIDGLMTSADVATLLDLVNKVSSLIAGGVWRATYETYADLIADYPNLDVSATNWFVNDFVEIIANENTDSTTPPHIQGASSTYIVQENTTDPDNIIKTLVFQRDDSSKVANATNLTSGVVKGSETGKWKIYVETDGTMTVIGGDDIEERLETIESEIVSLGNKNSSIINVGSNLSDTPECIGIDSLDGDRPIWRKTITGVVASTGADTSYLTGLLTTDTRKLWIDETASFIIGGPDYTYPVNSSIYTQCYTSVSGTAACINFSCTAPSLYTVPVCFTFCYTLENEAGLGPQKLNNPLYLTPDYANVRTIDIDSEVPGFFPATTGANFTTGNPYTIEEDGFITLVVDPDHTSTISSNLITIGLNINGKTVWSQHTFLSNVSTNWQVFQPIPLEVKAGDVLTFFAKAKTNITTNFTFNNSLTTNQTATNALLFYPLIKVLAPTIDASTVALKTDIVTHNTDSAAHDNVVSDVTTVKSLIPTQALPENQLADKNFVNSSVASIAAWKLYKDNNQSDFATDVEFQTLAATETDTNLVFYRADKQLHHSTVNDYVLIQSDLSHGGSTTRWKNFLQDDGVSTTWGYDMPLGGAFTAAQWTDINSGMTPELRNKVERLPAQEYMMLADNSSRIAYAGVFPTGTIPANVSTVFPEYTFTRPGKTQINAYISFNTAQTDVMYNIYINGNIVNSLSGLLNPSEVNNTRFRFLSPVFDVDAGDTMALAITPSSSSTIASNANYYFVFWPPKAVDPVFKVFKNMGSVPDMTGLPTAPADFDMYFVVASQKDVYARWINGALTWQDVRAVNQIMLGDSPDYASIDIVNKITTSGGTWTVEQDGYVMLRYGKQPGNSPTNAYASINGVNVQYSNLGTTIAGQSIYIGGGIFKVQTGDIIKVVGGLAAAGSPIAENGSDASFGCWYIPPRPSQDNVSDLTTALNAHMSDGIIHVVQGDKDSWNQKQDGMLAPNAYSDFILNFFSETTDPVMSDMPQWRKDLWANLPQNRLIRIESGAFTDTAPALGNELTALFGGQKNYGYFELFWRTDSVDTDGEQSITFVPVLPNYPTGTPTDMRKFQLTWNAYVWNGKPFVSDMDSDTSIKALATKIKSNQSGQVKVRYTGLSLTGFTSNTNVTMDVRSATAVVVDSPTTQWPQLAIDNSSNTYETGFFIQGTDSTFDRFRENNIPGQVHRWRVAGNYTNDDIGDMGRLRCFLFNPDTGFKVSANAVLPSGITDDDFTFEFTSIADNDSLATGRGYQLGFQTSYDTDTLVVNVNSIVRISEAIDYLR